MRCIICGQEKEPSIEHIVPAMLGNRSFTTDCVCNDCNKTLGHNIDSYFADNCFINIWRQAKGITSRNGEAVHAFDGLKTERDGVKYVIRDSVTHIIPTPIKTSTGYKITASLHDLDTAASIIEKRLKRDTKPDGKPFSQQEIDDLIKNAEITNRSVEPVKYDFPADLDYISISMEHIKIAYEFSFWSFGNDYWNDPMQSKLQRYVTVGLNYNHNYFSKIINLPDVLQNVVPLSDHYTKQLLPACQSDISKEIIHFLALIRSQNSIWCQIALCGQGLFSSLIKVSDDPERYGKTLPIICILKDGSYERFVLQHETNE